MGNRTLVCTESIVACPYLHQTAGVQVLWRRLLGALGPGELRLQVLRWFAGGVSHQGGGGDGFQAELVDDVIVLLVLILFIFTDDECPVLTDDLLIEVNNLVHIHNLQLNALLLLI